MLKSTVSGLSTFRVALLMHFMTIRKKLTIHFPEYSFDCRGTTFAAQKTIQTDKNVEDKVKTY